MKACTRRRASRSGMFFAKFSTVHAHTMLLGASDPNSSIAVEFYDRNFVHGTYIMAISEHLSCDLIFWPVDLQHLSHLALRTGIMFTKFEVGQLIPY